MGLRCLCVHKCMFSSALTGIAGVCAQRIHIKVFLVTVSQFSPMTLKFLFLCDFRKGGRHKVKHF